VNVGAGYPGVAEVQILINPMPYFGVELAGRKYVHFVAFRYRDVCDNEPVMVLRHVFVDGIGK
jgi:hypothetical protein